MDDLYADKADSEQNDAVAEMYAGSSKGNTENFVNGSEEILKHLTNTVKELIGPGSTLNSLMTSVKTLEQEVRALKRHNTSDEGVMSQKEARLDNSEGNAMEAQEETSGAKSSLDDIDSFFDEEDTEEQPEEVPDSDLLEDLDQYFVPKTETGEDISDKLASVVNRILREGPDEKKFKELKDQYKRPANLDNLQIPLIDNTLWRALDRQTRAVDLQLQKDMGNLATCMVPVLKIIDSLQNPTGNQKEDTKKIKTLAGDTFKLMSHFICSNIEQRKERIRKEKQLKPRVKSILKESTSSATQLFGDKLKDEMKVLNEKAISLTHDNTGDKTPFRPSHQSFLSKRGGGRHHQFQGRQQGSPYNQTYRDQGKPLYRQNQTYKKGTGSKGNYKRN